MRKSIAIALMLALAACALVGCGGGKTLRITNVNVEANTFDLVESGSGAKVSYDKLVVNGKEVIDWACSSMTGGTVMFATEEGQIVRKGNETTFNNLTAYTSAAKLEYELKDGVLTITGVK